MLLKHLEAEKVTLVNYVHGTDTVNCLHDRKLLMQLPLGL